MAGPVTREEMTRAEFTRLLKDLSRLSDAQLRKALQAFEFEQQQRQRRRRPAAVSPGRCPTGCAAAVQRWGRDGKGQARFRCTQCHKTFNARTGTPQAGQRHAASRERALAAVCSGTAADQAATMAGVHRSTLYRWLTQVGMTPEPSSRGAHQPSEAAVPRRAAQQRTTPVSPGIRFLG